MRLSKSKKSYNYQHEELLKLPTDVAQTLVDGVSKEYSRYIIKRRRFGKMIRFSILLPVIGIFLCDRYQHRWFILNRSLIYFINFLSIFISLLLIAHLITFIL
jgi:hypothetical protein